MADLNTAQRVPFAVTNPDGSPTTVDGTSCSGTAFTDFHDTTTGQRYIVGLTAGAGTLTVWKGARTGTLEVTVEDAPLVVTIGTPEPK